MNNKKINEQHTEKMLKYVRSDKYSEGSMYAYDHQSTIDWYNVYSNLWTDNLWFKILINYFDREWILNDYAKCKDFTNPGSTSDTVYQIYWQYLSDMEKYSYLSVHKHIDKYLKQVYLVGNDLKIDSFVLAAFEDNKKIIVDHIIDKCENKKQLLMKLL